MNVNSGDPIRLKPFRTWVQRIWYANSEEHLTYGELLEVALADANVLLKRFLRKVKHVGREERRSGGSEVLLRGGEEAIDPWKPGLLAVISVEHNGNSVKLGNLVHVLGTSDGSSN